MATVLVVEDEEVQRKAIETILRATGHQVLLAGNGPQALVVAADKRPEIVICDLVMPRIGGNEVCEKIRADPGTAHAWILMVTAHEKEGTREAALKAGADDFVRKPVEMDDLVMRVRVGSKAVKLRRAVEEERQRTLAAVAAQEAVVAALDSAVQGLQASASHLQQGDAVAALRSLEGAYAAVQRTLAKIDPGAG